MSFMGAGGGVAMGPASGLRFAQTRGRIQGGNITGVNYPSPFFDVAHTYLPVTVKALFKWCRYYVLTNPLINATVFKLSEYPVTDIIIDHDSPEVKKRWTEYFQDHLRWQPFRVECGLDFFAYGNGFVSLGFPFKKYLYCKSCNFRDEAGKIRAQWIFTSFQFRLTCPKCGYIGDALAKDIYLKNASGIKTIRWNAEDIEVSYNDISGEHTYFYTIPATVRNDIVIGRKDTLEGIPQVFIQAMREQKGVIFSKDNFFHMRRPTLATQDRGWGTPLLLPVLKDTFYLQLMKKAQEAILLEHIVPLRVLFPQAGSGSSDPYTTINLLDWRDQVAAEIARWRMDCVTPETLVETSEGLRAASDVHEGDSLKNHLGTYSRVEKAWRRPLREGERAYQIVARGLHGAIPTVSEGHPFLISRKYNNGNGHKLSATSSFVRAKDIHVGDYVGYPIPVFEPHGLKELDLAQFCTHAVTEKWLYIDHQSPETPEAFEYMEANGGPAIDRAALLEQRCWSVSQYKAAQNAFREGRTPCRLPRFIPFDEELCWVLGLYLAEGSASPKQVLFALHRDETDFVEKLDRFFMERFGANGFTAVRGENGIQRYYSSTVAAQLFHELCSGIATSKRIHGLLKCAGGRRLAALMRGYFDGDGCYHENDGCGRYDVGTASRQLAADVRDILLSVGILTGLTYTQPVAYEICGKRGMSHGAYRVASYGEGTERFRAWLNGAALPNADYHMGVIKDGYVWLRIQEVCEVEAAEVIGFQMDKAVSVMLEDDTEAHGTFAVWGMVGGNSNYIPIMPLPLGNQTIGGDGKALMLTQEIESWSNQILNGMGVPVEFIRGGLSYAGTNVSMRMMENMFLGYISRQKALAKFVMKQVAAYLGWPEANIRFKPFKMADDLQRKAYLFQLNQANKVSDTTLLADSDLSQDEENAIMIRETDARIEATKKQQLAMATIQGEAQQIMMKFQTKAQQDAQKAMGAPVAPGEPGGADMQGQGGGPGGAGGGGPSQEMPEAVQAGSSSDAAGGAMQPQGPAPGVGPSPQDFLTQVSSQLTGAQKTQDSQNIGLLGTAEAQAKVLVTLPKNQQAVALQNISMQSPELAELVQQAMAELQPADPGAAAQGAGVDTRPNPAQRPPRRIGAAV